MMSSAMFATLSTTSLKPLMGSPVREPVSYSCNQWGCGMVDHLGATEADFTGIDTAVVQATDKRRSKGRAGLADIPADSHRPPGLDDRRITAADAVGDILVQLVGDAAANVVGFETAGCSHEVSKRFRPQCNRGAW